MKLRKFSDNILGVLDITLAITVEIMFAALMVIAYIIWTLNKVITPAAPSAGTGVSSTAYNVTYNFILHSNANITGGFDQTVKIIVIAVLVSVLAVALSYLMMLRQG